MLCNPIEGGWTLDFVYTYEYAQRQYMLGEWIVGNEQSKKKTRVNFSNFWAKESIVKVSRWTMSSQISLYS